MHRNALSILAAAALTAPMMVSAAAEWTTDFEAAKAQAAKEGKAVLMDFTGSDWCGWCIKLRKEVFDKSEFQEYARDKFVLMEVDMPRNRRQAPQLALQNNKLCKQFQVQGFPTILVISPEGDVLGGFVGGNSSFEQTRQQLDPAFENLGKLKAARAKEGVERAKDIAEIYKSLPKEFIGIAQGYLAEIEANDPAGVSKALELTPEEEMEDFIAELHQVGNDYKKALELIEAKLAGCADENRPELLKLKAMALTYGAGTEADIVEARKALEEAVGMLGYSHEAKELRKYIKEAYSDPAALLQQIKQSRVDASRSGGCGSDLQKLIGNISGADDATALSLIEAQLDKGNEEEKPELLRLKATVLLRMADSLEDVAKAKALFEESAALFGDTLDGDNLRSYIQGEFADPEALLKGIRSERAKRANTNPADEEELHNVILAIHRVGNDYKKALEIIEAQLAKGKAGQRAELLRLKGLSLIYSAETVEDLVKAKEAMLEAAELMGDTEEADQIRKYIEDEMKDQDGLLERMKLMR